MTQPRRISHKDWVTYHTYQTYNNTSMTMPPFGERVYGDYQPEPPNSETFSPFPILGWRIWYAHQPNIKAPIYLQGFRSTEWWQPFLTAECFQDSWIGSRFQIPPHTVPGWECECGIYAAKNLEDVEDSYSGFNGVFGIVAMSNVIEHVMGYRAAEATVIALYPRHHYMRNQLVSSHSDCNEICRWRHVAIPRSREKMLRIHDYYSRRPYELAAKVAEIRGGHDEDR